MTMPTPCEYIVVHPKTDALVRVAETNAIHVARYILRLDLDYEIWTREQFDAYKGKVLA